MLVHHGGFQIRVEVVRNFLAAQAPTLQALYSNGTDNAQKVYRNGYMEVPSGNRAVTKQHLKK